MSKISVVMSVYNGEKYLREAIESILSQTEGDLEIIIINDGSTDSSLSIINQYKEEDKRIRIISRENKGLVSSLNEGVELAQGEYIARMDADDISRPDRLEKQLEYIRENDLVVCGTRAEGMSYPPDSSKIRFFTLFHNPFIHSSIIFRRDIFLKVGGYRKFFKHVEDYELWTRIVFKYKTGNIPENLFVYRVHEGQITKKNNLEMRLKGIIVRILAWWRFMFRFGATL